MKKAFAAGIGAIALTFALTAQAEAQLVAATPAVNCNVWVAAWDACSGAWDGNNKNQTAAVISEIETQGWLTGVSEMTSVDTDGWGTSGTINFGTTYTDFVIALKAGNAFSLYYFEGGLASLDFSTAGSGVNVNGKGETVVNGLSHWTVYGGRETSVPEPGTMLLLGTGLLGMAFARRREDVA